jgi:predicted nucleic acid-binding protein
VLSEYYVTVTRKLAPGLPPEEAWDDVSALLAWNPQPIDRGVLTGAHEIEQRYRLSWWDSLVVAAAQVQGCAILLSEDLQDGATFAGVTVRNPFSFGVAQATASYDVASATRARRATRGRAVRPG